MGKISKVFYTEIEPEICNSEDAAKWNYYFNLVKYDKTFWDEYEKYEAEQIKVRNKIIGDAIRSGEIGGTPKIYTTIFGISSKKNKAVLITEI